MSNSLKVLKNVGIAVLVIAMIPIFPIIVDVIFTLGQYVGSTVRSMGIC